VPAVPSSPILTVVDDSDPLLGELAEVPLAPDGLLELVARAPDPRQRRGIRHGLTGVLAVALSPVVAGAQSFVAIAEWAADAAPEVLAGLGVTGVTPTSNRMRSRAASQVDGPLAPRGDENPRKPAPSDRSTALAAAGYGEFPITGTTTPAC